MKVGYLQYCPVFGDIEKNIELINRMLSNLDCDLIVLPELAFSGYNFSSKEELFKASENINDSKAISEMKKLSQSKNCSIISGFSEIDGDNIYNSSFLVSKGELLGIYRKLHLFNKEKELFTPGNYHLNVYEINNVKVGMMICFDWAFPEVARTLALRGADIICQPANLVLTYCQDAMITRSIENHVFTITANRIGREKELSFTGQSQITGTKGDIIFRDKSDSESLKIVEINPALSRNKKITDNNNLFEDRRKEFYL